MTPRYWRRADGERIEDDDDISPVYEPGEMVLIIWRSRSADGGWVKTVERSPVVGCLRDEGHPLPVTVMFGHDDEGWREDHLGWAVLQPDGQVIRPAYGMRDPMTGRFTGEFDWRVCNPAAWLWEGARPALDPEAAMRASHAQQRDWLATHLHPPL
jgi:hypothetical protein